MKRIVVATDFSVRSERAVQRAALLAKVYHSSLTILHVIDYEQPQGIIDAGLNAASHLMAELVASIRDRGGIDCDSDIILADPFDGILTGSERMDADLLVIGAHRRQLLRVFGTTAERTIRNSRRPVLMANLLPTGPYRHMLITLDLSENSIDVIRELERLGLKKNTKTTVLHVFDAPEAGLMIRTSTTAEELRNYLAEERDKAEIHLSELLRKTQLQPNQQLVKLNERSIVGEIEKTGQELAVDIVVMGASKRSAIARLFLGSITEETMRRADVDALVIPNAA